MLPDAPGPSPARASEPPGRPGPLCRRGRSVRGRAGRIGSLPGMSPEDEPTPAAGTSVGLRWRRPARGPLALMALTVAVGGFWMTSLRQGLPYLHHPDEPTNLLVADRMVTEGDPNPQFFNYPSLFFYVHAAVHLEGPLLGWTGATESRPEVLVMGTARTGHTGSVMVHRFVSVVCGLAAVVGAYAAARALAHSHRSVAGLVAAGLVGGSLTVAASARMITPDVLATALVTGVLWAAAHLHRRGARRWLVAAGVLAGLAASAKYNAAAVLMAPGAALLVGAARRPAWARRVVDVALLGAVAGASFLATTPYALLDRSTFWQDVRYEMRHYATGHPGMEGGAPAWYAQYLLTREALLVVLAGLGLAVLTRRRDWRTGAVVAAFPLVYGVAIAFQPVRNARTIVLVLPFLAVVAGLGGAGLAGFLARRGGGGWRPVGGVAGRSTRVAGLGAAVVVVVAALGAQGAGLVSVARVEAHVHTSVPPLGRLQPRGTTWAAARRWIEQSLPAGSVVRIEAYAPWVEPTRYQVHVVRSFANLTPAERARPGYYVATESMYGRFLADPGRYPRQAAAYRELFGSAERVATFRGSGPDIVVVHRRG